MTEDVPGYRVLDKAGEGGFAIVYRAHQEHLDRMVALKVLSIDSVDDAAMRRFQRESKITGRLSDHPNIVTVLDTGTTRAGRPYIAMEYFEHGALSDKLAREGPLPVAEVLRIGVKMAGALTATHETDVLHRDIKPQNMLLSRYGEPALADFGIARLVDTFDATHTQAFTPLHAAPEILEGRTPAVGADIYSLGSTLYQLLSGQPAFKGPGNEGIAQLMLRILNEPPPPISRPDVPRQVSDVIVRAMAKTPQERFATALEFAQTLQGLQSELGLPVTDVAHSGAAGPPVPRTGGGAGSPSQSSPSPGPSSQGAPHPGAAPSGAPPSHSPSGTRLSFPDTSVSGSSHTSEWAPTAQAPPDLAPDFAPGPAGPPQAPAGPASPWHPGALPPQQPTPLLPQDGMGPPQAPPALPQAPPSGPSQAPGHPPQAYPEPPQPYTAPQAHLAPPHAHAAPPHAHTTPHGGPHELTLNQPRGGGSPRRGLLVVAGVAVVGGLVIGVGALAMTGGGDDEEAAGPPAASEPASPGQAAQAPAEPVTPAQLAAARPRALAVKPAGNGSGAVLAWTLPAEANELPLLIQQRPVGDEPLVSVRAGSRSATMPGLQPGTRYCFKVGAVLRLNQGQAPDVSWSEPACTGGQQGA